MADNATSELILKIKALGGHLAKEEIDGVTRALKRQDRASQRVTKRWAAALNPINAVSRAIKLALTRTILATGVIVGLSFALAILSPGLAFVTAGLVSMAMALGPIALLAALAFNQFQNQMNIVGTAAYGLLSTFMDLRQEVERAFGPAADIILRGVGAALKALEPLIQALAPSLTMLAGVLAQGMLQFAQGVTAMGPKMATFITGLAPMIPRLVRLLLLFLDLMLEIGIRGLPAMMKLLDWGADFLIWAIAATANIDRFLHSTEGADSLQRLADIARGFWDVLKKVADGAFWASQHFHQMFYVIGLLIGTSFILWLSRVLGLTRLMTGAWTALNFVMDANPGVLLLLGFAAIGAGLVLLETKFHVFSKAVSWAWSTLKNLPHLVWGQITTGLDVTLNWIIDRVNDLINGLNKLSPFGDVQPLSHVGSGPGANGGFNPLAAQGVVGGTAGSATPRRRPADDRPDAYARATPPDEMASPYTIVLDGKVIARGVHRATTKKKSTK